MRRGSRGAVVIACIAVTAMATLIGTAANADAASSKPGVPTGVIAQPGDGAASVSWTPPSNSGGSPIIGYAASAGSKACTTTGATTCTISGLRNGQNYKVKVKATNSQGTGKRSSIVDVEPGLPGEPTGVATVAENGAVLVSWTPAADNGSPISNYNVVAAPGPRGCNAAATTSCTVAGLTNGISHVEKQFFEDGGLGILAGDGKLHYGWEKILETYYDVAVWKSIHASLDYQFIDDPAFNRDRGPVSVFAVRLHWEL